MRSAVRQMVGRRRRRRGGYVFFVVCMLTINQLPTRLRRLSMVGESIIRAEASGAASSLLDVLLAGRRL
jgi:hypothetical protein